MKSIWFTPLTGGIIGIVKTDSGRVYIGTGKGLSKSVDEEFIAEYGSLFDLDSVAKHLDISRKNFMKNGADEL